MPSEAEIEAGCKAALQHDNAIPSAIEFPGFEIPERRWRLYREVVLPILKAAERVRFNSKSAARTSARLIAEFLPRDT